jgi:CBS domain-containing protein
VLGLISGILLIWVLKRISDPDKMLVFVLGAVLLILGVAISLRMDVILAAMALGATLVNVAPSVSQTVAQAALDVLHKFFAPIYILFFVLVGARVSFSHVNKMILVLVAAYVTGSISGKTLGAYLGGVCSDAVKTVRNYLGFCLYPQGGIAVALLIIASHRFESNISAVMLLVVIIGAFILQMIGPIGVKIGAGKAGELGLNVTEEDLIKTRKVGDVMATAVPVISVGASLSEVIKLVGATDSSYYPVVGDDKKLIGAITLDGIRNTFATQELNDWLVALDIMEPVTARATPDMALSEALEQTGRLHLGHLPIVASSQNNVFVGVLDRSAVRRQLSAEVLSRQQKADNIAVSQNA